MDTAGRAVFFAGITVVISLLGMLLMGAELRLRSRHRRRDGRRGHDARVAHAAAGIARLRRDAASRSPAGGADRRGSASRSRCSASGSGSRPLLLGARRTAHLRRRLRHLAARQRGAATAADSRSVRRSPIAGAGSSSAARGSGWSIGAGVLLLLAAPVLVAAPRASPTRATTREDTTTRRAYDLLARGLRPRLQRAAAGHARAPPSHRTAPASPAVHDALEAAPGVARRAPAVPNDLENPTAPTPTSSR